jgi:hypothetical protein
MIGKPEAIQTGSGRSVSGSRVVFTDDFRAKRFPVSDSSPGKRANRTCWIFKFPITRLSGLYPDGTASGTCVDSKRKVFILWSHDHFI